MTLLFYNINVSFILYYLLMNYILIMLLIFSLVYIGFAHQHKAMALKGSGREV